MEREMGKLFRSWNDEEKVFYYFKNGCYYKDAACEKIISESRCNEFYWGNAKQFTGLTDKNGVKIFEGKNSVKLTVIGLGEGFADVVLHEGKWCIYEKSQGYAPLFDNLNNNAIIIEAA